MVTSLSSAWRSGHPPSTSQRSLPTMRMLNSPSKGPRAGGAAGSPSSPGNETVSMLPASCARAIAPTDAPLTMSTASATARNRTSSDPRPRAGTWLCRGVPWGRALTGSPLPRGGEAKKYDALRRAWDSNPRDISAHQFSRLAPSAARTALLNNRPDHNARRPARPGAPVRRCRGSRRARSPGRFRSSDSPPRAHRREPDPSPRRGPPKRPT